MKRKSLAFGAAGAVVVILAVTLVLFHVCRPRERTHHASCASNLKQILYGCHLYAADNDGSFPPSLGALYPAYLKYGGVFVCPRSRRWTRELEEADLPDGAADASAVLTPKNADYIYLSGFSTSDDWRCVVVFDRLGDHEGGRNVGLVCGYVTWLKERDFQEALARTIEYRFTRDASVFDDLTMFDHLKRRER